MSKTVIVTKENRGKFWEKMGTFQVMNDGQPVMNKKGKPWKGKTRNMANYFGIIVGGQKYESVKQRGAWQDGYEIHFTEMTEQEFSQL